MDGVIDKIVKEADDMDCYVDMTGSVFPDSSGQAFLRMSTHDTKALRLRLDFERRSLCFDWHALLT